MAAMTAALGAAVALRRRGVGVLAVLAAVTVGAFVAALLFGAVPIPFDEAVGLLAGAAGDSFAAAVLIDMRLPRALLVALVGGGLAVAGAALQGLFRNPLADPALIGVSTGAALAVVAVLWFNATLALMLPPEFFAYAMPTAAFVGGMAAVALTERIARHDGRTDVAKMLLAGVALNAVNGAAVGYFVFASDDQQLRDLNFWLLGSFAAASWEKVLPAVLIVGLPAAGLLPLARALNALALGEIEATHLGFDVERVKRAIIVLVALSVGASVALVGVVAFVGLVVPHLVRLTAGPDHRLLLPAAALHGASLLLIADILARLIVLPAELPIGIITSLIGGPFFVWLLLRRRVGMSW